MSASDWGCHGTQRYLDCCNRARVGDLCGTCGSTGQRGGRRGHAARWRQRSRRCARVRCLPVLPSLPLRRSVCVLRAVLLPVRGPIWARLLSRVPGVLRWCVLLSRCSAVLLSRWNAVLLSRRKAVLLPQWSRLQRPGAWLLWRTAAVMRTAAVAGTAAVTGTVAVAGTAAVAGTVAAHGTPTRGVNGDHRRPSSSPPPPSPSDTRIADNRATLASRCDSLRPSLCSSRSPAP
jgi:hypothetical protein